MDDGARARDEVLDALSNQVGMVLDHAGRVVAVTPAAHAVLGGRLAIGLDFVDLLAPDDRPTALTLLTTGPVDTEIVLLRCAHLDGSYRTLACRSRAAAGGELVICADDVTARERARAEITVHEGLLALVRRESGPADVYDAIARFAAAAAPGTRVALYRVDEEHIELLATSNLPTVWSRVASRVLRSEVESDAVDVEPAAGRIAELGHEHGLGFGWMVRSGEPANADGEVGDPEIAVCAFVGAKRFLTASERAGLTRTAELVATAVSLHEQVASADARESVDPSTGVLSRQAFFDALDAAPRPVTLMLVHVGGIAVVNAAHGYAAGDATLRAVAAALQGVVRRRDVVGRLSGATFVIAGSARATERDAGRWADRVRDAVRTRLVAAGRVLEPACRVTHVTGLPGRTAAEILLQAEAQLRGSVTGITDRGDATSGRRAQDR